MSDNRTEYTVYVTFYNPEENLTEDVLIHVPFDVMIDVVRTFCISNYSVSLDGTDNSIWNLFCTTNFFEELYEDEDFVADIIAAYRNTLYYDEDFTEWVDMTHEEGGE